MKKSKNGQEKEQHYDAKLFSEKSKLVDQNINRLVDDFFADEKALCKFLAAMVAVYAQGDEQSNEEGSEAEKDELPNSTAIWMNLLYDRFYKELIRSIDEHLRPIVYGYNDQELDDLCQQILSMNCNVVMERILDRISTLDVPSLLMKNKAYLEE